jgi:hypothetical protein
MARDPRQTPAVGDCFLKGKPKGVLERTVVAVGADRVEFVAKGKRYATTIGHWREWSVDARITKVVNTG